MFLISCILTGCGIVKINLDSKTSDDCQEKEILCEECRIQPKSGAHRDLRYGYYCDINDKKCKQVSYSTGPGCIPPPFKTMEECKDCCCK